MIAIDTIIVAMSSLMNNRLRSFLSMLGIIIGVAAVIAVISVGNGAEKQVLTRLESVGTNLIAVTPGISRGSASNQSRELGDVFTYEMAKHILSFCPSIENAVPYIDGQVLSVYGNVNMQTRVRATTKEFLTIANLKVSDGRMFSNIETEEEQFVVVLGARIATDLFGTLNPIGQRLRISRGSRTFDLTVIGVLEEKGQSILANYDSQIFVPITTWMNRIQRTRFVNGFVAQARSSEEASIAVAEIEYLLYQKLEDLDKFDVFSQTEMLEMASEFANIFKVLLGGIASIALLVGGIGIMNITLVSVTERTREIGIRKALGAKKHIILLQFLIEACVTSGFGGVIGLGTGIAGSAVIAKIGGWPLVVTPSSVVIGIVFSTLIGLFFGIYPASKAASLDPVQALSYE
jgi:putative ABC transport system permease protein